MSHDQNGEKEANKKMATLHPADEGLFNAGFVFQCRKCGYVVDTFDEWTSIEKTVLRKHLFYDITEEAIYVCPKCGNGGDRGIDWEMVESD